MLLGGCSDGVPQASAPPTATANSPAGEDTPGLNACGALEAAVADATLMTPGVVDAIVRASAAADAPVADAAQRLATAYAAATAAGGTDGEPDAVAAVSVAGADMTSVCADSGLDTVG
jgi:hypothetical protein